MIYDDDRIAKCIPIEDYPIVIGGRDPAMSGWGKAKGGSSFVYWACRREHADRVESWVRAYKGLTMIGVWEGLPPEHNGRGHSHVYVVGDGHPALA